MIALGHRRRRYLALMREESADLAGFLAGIDADAWDHESLCAGWQVRHVVAHLAVGHTLTFRRFCTAVARGGLSIPRASYRLALAFGDAHEPAELLAAFRGAALGPVRGPIALVDPAELFVDHLIHHQDVRRPLGLPRAIPRERLVAALDALPHVGGQLHIRRRLRGLRLVATDLGHDIGAGLPVWGPAEALVLAAGGRPAALADLHGPGVAVLAARLPRSGAPVATLGPA